MLTWNEHSDWIGALDLSPDGKWIVSGGGEGRVLLWNVALRSLEKELYRHSGAVRWARFSPTKPWIAAACEVGEVRIWDFMTGKPPTEIPEGKLTLPVDGQRASTSRNGVFCAKGSMLFADYKSALYCWDLREDVAPAE